MNAFTEIGKKKLFHFLSIIFFYLLPFYSFSQDNQTLEFKGIPIQGTLEIFSKQLENKGFEKQYEAETGAILTGKFIGEDVTLAIICSPRTKSVWKVTVLFPEKKSWASLKSQYNDINDLYKQKYTYDINYEFFSDPYYEGDGYEISAFKNEKANWITFYKEGIMVQIDDNARVAISYENSENAETARRERESNNLDEI